MLIITKGSSHTPGHLCRVLSQTAKMYTVEVLVKQGYGSHHLQGGYRSDNPHPKVNKDDVLVEDVSREQYDDYIAAFNAREQAIREAITEASLRYEGALRSIFVGH